MSASSLLDTSAPYAIARNGPIPLSLVSVMSHDRSYPHCHGITLAYLRQNKPLSSHCLPTSASEFSCDTPKHLLSTTMVVIPSNVQYRFGCQLLSFGITFNQSFPTNS